MQKIRKMTDFSLFVRVTCDECGKEEEYPPVGKGYFSRVTTERLEKCNAYLKSIGWLPNQPVGDKPIGLRELKDFCCEECYKKFINEKRLLHLHHN